MKRILLSPVKLVLTLYKVFIQRGYTKPIVKFVKVKNIGGITLYPLILINDKFKKPEYERRYNSIMVHEMVHWNRQKDSKSLILWYLSYVFSRGFRLDEELRAYKEEFLAGGVTEHYCAESLSSRLYFKMISYDRAKLLVESWKKE